MKSVTKRITLAVSLGAVAIAASGCAVGFVETPPTNITATGATLNGSVGSDRAEQGVYWFEYGPGTGYGSSSAHRTIALAAQVKKPVSEAVSGLTAGTDYHYRLCARDDDPDSRPLCSKDSTFTTKGTRPDRPRYVLHIDASDGTDVDPQSGVADVAISVDGQQVDGQQPGCSTQNCSISQEWALDADDYAPGTHAVKVRVTDGVGRTTTRDLNIEIQRDTTQPDLTVSGPLKAAPKGWVGQRSYTVTAATKDGGYGVTSVKLLIDGQETGGAASQPCPDGGCSLDKTFTVNTANYAGGAHSVELKATDGAGNTTSSRWTMNVNPEGDVSTAEATATLAAADSTSSTSVVGPNEDVIDPGELAAGNDPKLVQSGSALTTTGTGASSELTTDPSSGFTINTPDDAIQVIPEGTDSTATTAAVANDVAAVSANTDARVDAVLRPIFDGVMTFKSIRDEASPEEFSWRVLLDHGQTLRSIDAQTAEIYYADGTPAMMISVQVAHDATGATVPAALRVNGTNVITLTVAHRNKGFVYPIAAGSGWQAPYIMPTQNPETGTSEDLWVGAPVLERDEVDPLERTRPVHRRPFDKKFCESAVVTCYLSMHIKGNYFYSGKYGSVGGHAWWNYSRGSDINCYDWSSSFGVFWTDKRCSKFVGPNYQPYGHGYHITARASGSWNTNPGPFLGQSGDEYYSVYLFGSGNIVPRKEVSNCNPIQSCD